MSTRYLLGSSGGVSKVTIRFADLAEPGVLENMSEGGKRILCEAEGIWSSRVVCMGLQAAEG
jgi:hypothetical protein